MFLDIKVKDIAGSVKQKVNYNEVIIHRRELLTIPKLLQYFNINSIHIQEEARLDSFPLHVQNEIGVIYIEYYNFLINRDGTLYLDELKFKNLFYDNEIIMEILNGAKIQSPGPEGTIDLNYIGTYNLNIIIINFFNKQFKNFKSDYKNIIETTALFDIDLNYGKFSKVTNLSEFLVTSFDRYIRTRRGEIPFSNNFGSTLKASIQRKADSFTQTILEEEIMDFIDSLSILYNNIFSFESLTYREVGVIDVHVELQIVFSIMREENIEIKVVF